MALPAVRALDRPHDLLLFVVAAVVVALDQASKALITATIDRGDSWPSDDWPFRFVHITNSGAAFGMLQDTGPLLAVASVVGVAIILVYLFAPGITQPELRYGLALMLGGAFGNLIDRWLAGEVVDFIHVPNFPSFNVADSAITIGVLLLLWGLLRETRETNETADPSTSDASPPGERDGSTR